ncbi:MAG: transposase [Bdellovibrionales bacterium]
MSKRPKRKFSDETKYQAVDDYTSGRKTAVEVATELDVHPGQIYNCKTQLEETRIKGRVTELVAAGRSIADARLIQQQEDEISEYKKLLAEKTMLLELLKKLREHPNCPPLRSVSGPNEMAQLLEIQRKLAKS